ncbi:hypothetical protein MRB53_034789 [Persea americana]|uniref:Uncharacterized protein n=1 Tax=Persea americana TaxID=3435 RepID=A0ACC2K2T4_PERAE|nr:hypothetical protein MRB53_034789 [Persea americana]
MVNEGHHCHQDPSNREILDMVAYGGDVGEQPESAVKKSFNETTTFTFLDALIFIDVEEYMDPLPNYVKQTEAMLEEMEALDDCDLEELEMTDLDAEPVLDIDSGSYLWRCIKTSYIVYFGDIQKFGGPHKSVTIWRIYHRKCMSGK